jgi:hypothetical protein
MPKERKIFIVARQRAFDDERWKRLLVAFSYYLHEERKRTETEDGNGRSVTAGNSGGAA